MTSNIRKFQQGEVFKSTNDDKDLSYNAYDVDMAVVQIYFENPAVFQYLRQPKSTWVDFFSSIGGLLGLCLGLSIVTVVELFWLCFTMGRKIVNPQF